MSSRSAADRGIEPEPYLANPSRQSRLSREQREALYELPRTSYQFSDDPVTEEQLREIYRLTALGPTAYNNQPLRITWVRSKSAKERLLGYLHESNRDAAASAPVNAVLGYDKNWQKRFAEFAPHAVAAQEFFEAEEERIPLGRLNAQVQAGYFITVVRALGLDAGPITGVDFEALAADPVLLGGADQQPFLVVNLGYGLGPIGHAGCALTLRMSRALFNFRASRPATRFSCAYGSPETRRHISRAGELLAFSLHLVFYFIGR